jgi:predicted DNA-binding transcriptional regulator YafY
MPRNDKLIRQWQLLHQRESTTVSDIPRKPSRHTTHGELTIPLNVPDNRELLGWIVSFGSSVQVMQPTSLREAVRQEAKAIADQPQESPGRLLDVSLKEKRGDGCP